MSKAKASAGGTQLVRLLVPAGKASPSPPVGPALGQRGVKSIDFCKQFNDRTKHFTSSLPVRALITVNADRSFTFVVKSPPTSWLLLQAAGIEKGTSRPSHVEVGQVSVKHVYEIAKIKMTDPGSEDTTLEKMCSRVLAQAKGMGIKVVY
ncbi:ribosomal protein L11, RNA binding domain-containing protein [Zopfochytrium polystomum]|nr:ribosomal protein L11, RNA binding domain-containing protein [Zopfochytrium polystomum]